MGESLPRPPNCTDKLWQIIQACLNIKPEHRPSFAHLVYELQDYQQQQKTQTKDPYALIPL